MYVKRALGPLTATVRGREIVELSQDYDRSDPDTKRLLVSIGA